jgi:dipeptidyl aminopeptidase/acylaminoacyl peptidase
MPVGAHRGDVFFDGTEIEALLLKPRNYRTGTRLPLVVMVHGGPTGRWSDSFEAWGQLLAARGYAVLYPNVRGSTREPSDEKCGSEI